MTVTAQDIKTFVNPTNYWGYDGAFSVELIEGTDTRIAPPTAQVNGNIVTIANGRIQQSIGGIDLFSQGKPFCWGYRFIKTIRDGNGGLLWVNYRYR